MMDSLLLKFCFLVLLLALITNAWQPGIVQTTSGPIQGFPVNIEGRTVYQYLGIPYAQPPVGELRFKRPQPIQPWSDILIADRMPPACMQYSIYPFPWYDFQDVRSEDCLYLNMWVPEANEWNRKKAVMFWIHGGSFSYGSIGVPTYDGRALAAVGDVIVVTTNYRLGAFGFFTTNTDAAPVNNALYDMLEALKWINKNAAAFGGDPNQVTVFGESAGSWATGWFCLSPLTKGLFNRVIMQSGSPAYAGFYDNTTSLLTSQKLANTLGCIDKSTNIFTLPDKVARCMRGKDAFEIAKTLNSFNPNTGLLYNPVSGNEFLPLNPDEALKTGNFHNVSVLIGNNRDEAVLFLTAYFSETLGFFGEKLSQLNIAFVENMFKDFVRDFFEVMPGTNLLIETVLGSLSADDHRKNLKSIYDIFSDIILVCPDEYFAESFSRYGKEAYFYFFKHRPSTTPWADWMGVVHFEEVQFVFGSPLKENRYTYEEVELSKLMIKMWSNFAKYGDPFYNELQQGIPGFTGLLQNSLRVNKWPVYSRETPLYLILDNTTGKAAQYDFGPDRASCDLLRSVHGFP